MSEVPPGAVRSSEPVFRIPAVVVATVGLLVAVHTALVFAGEQWQVWSLYLFAFIPARISGAAAYPGVTGSGIWSWFTYALLHGSWLHLISNCLWLIVFGTVVARRLSALGFVLLSIAAAAGSALVMLLLHRGEDLLLIGASGSVSGLLAASIPLMYAKGRTFRDVQSTDLSRIVPLRPLEILTDRNALIFTLIWFGLTLLTGASGGWMGNSFADTARIAWEAHLGGFLAGLAAFYLLDRQGDLPKP